MRPPNMYQVRLEFMPLTEDERWVVRNYYGQMIESYRSWEHALQVANHLARRYWGADQ